MLSLGGWSITRQNPLHLFLLAEAQQLPPSAAFQEMVNIVHQQLTPNVYHFIFDASNVEDGDQNRAPNAEQQVRRAKKEGKQVGLLVKAIEEWEFNLIKLTRNCKLRSPWLSCHCSCGTYENPTCDMLLLFLMLSCYIGSCYRKSSSVNPASGTCDLMTLCGQLKCSHLLLRWSQSDAACKEEHQQGFSHHFQRGT